MAVGLLPISALAKGDQAPHNSIEVPIEALYYESTSGGIAIQGIRKDWFREHCADNGKENPAYLSIHIPAQIGINISILRIINWQRLIFPERVGWNG